MEIKGFKLTEVGWIPEDWEVKKLNFICDVRDGTHESPKYHADGIVLITSKNINNGKIDFSEVNYISFEDAKNIDKRSKVDKGDILMSMIGTIGNCVLINFEPNFCIKNVALLKPHKVEGEYLVQLLFSDFYQQYIKTNLDGGIQKFISLGALRNLDVPLPPTTAEQTAIATALNDADALIQKLEQLIAKKRVIKQGAMQELLKPKEGWEVKKLGEVAEIEKGEQLNRQTLLEKDTYPVFNGGITPSGYTNKWNTEKDTIIISEGGNSCGYVNFIKERFWRGGHCYQVVPKINKMFLFHLLKSIEKEIMSLRVGSGLPNIQKNRLTVLEISFPPNKSEQTRIAQILTDMDNEIEALEKQLEKYKTMKQGMMQMLLTGKIRLVKPNKKNE